MSQLVERHDRTVYDPGRFLDDLRLAARAVEGPFDADVVKQTLEVFDDEFRRCVVQMKAHHRLAAECAMCI